MKTVFSKHVTIMASSQEVWDLISNFDELMKVLPNEDELDYLTDQKNGLGMQTKWYRTSPLDGLVEWYEEVSEWDPLRRITFLVKPGLSDPPRVLGSLRITPLQDGVDLEFYEERYYINPDKKAIEKAMMEELNAIKDYFESG